MENKEEKVENKVEKVRPEPRKPIKPVFEDISLDEDELIEKKLHLAQCKIQKDDSDIELETLEKQLDAKIPNKFLDDDIKSYEKQIKEKVDKEGQELTEADIEFMKIHLYGLRKKRKLDTEMKKLRLKIEGMRYQKSRPDSPENQIKKLEREIRTNTQRVMRVPTPTEGFAEKHL